MKTIVGLMVVAVLVLGTVVGCDTTPSEQGHRDVSVGPMTLSVPDDWERPDDYAELTEELFTIFPEEEKEAIRVDFYGDEAEETILVPMTLDMAEYAELMGLTWRGWDIEMAEAGMTTEEYAEMAHWGLLTELTEISRETHRQLNIGGHEAWESTYTAELEGEPAQVCILIVFPPDGVGILLMMMPQDKWSGFEEVWETIVDSISI